MLSYFVSSAQCKITAGRILAYVHNTIAGHRQAVSMLKMQSEVFQISQRNC